MKIKRFLTAILLIAIIAALLTSCGEYPRGKCEYTKSRDISERDITYVEMSVKGYGKMVLLLDATTAPMTVANFLELVGEGFYDGLTFHRVVDDFMIQGGDPDGTGGGGSDEEIIGEFLYNGYPNDISHIRGVISMARGYDFDSASSQFFICNADSTLLDGQYAAFGYVVAGLSVVDKITKKTVDLTVNENLAPEDQPVIEYIKVLPDYGK